MIKYTVVANEDGREATQYIVKRRPADTLDVAAVNELVAPEQGKEYWDLFRNIVYGQLEETSNVGTN